MGTALVLKLLIGGLALAGVVTVLVVVRQPEPQPPPQPESKVLRPLTGKEQQQKNSMGTVAPPKHNYEMK